MADPTTVRLLAAVVPRAGAAVYRRYRLGQRDVDEKAFDKIVDKIAREADALRATEFRGLPEHEWKAAAECVKAAFGNVGRLDARVTLRHAMDPERLAEWLRGLAPDLPREYGLTPVACGAYERLSVLACAAVVEFVRRHPDFPQQVEIEQLERLERIEAHVATPTDAELRRFEKSYCASVARRLDRLELFGVTLRDQDFHYPMSTAYISVAGQSAGGNPVGGQEVGGQAISACPPRIEQVIGAHRRVLLSGEAGSGKTTLMQRLALWAARDGFPGELRDWEGVVPFFIPLRHFDFAARLPAPEDFLDYTSPLLRAEMPDSWVRGLLREGRALLLIDGVDELPEEQRERMRRVWLEELLAMYPATRVVVSSRPSALERRHDTAGFRTATLQPMTLADQRAFVAHWHGAVAAYRGEDPSTEFQSDLVAKLASRRHLRRLAANPLLCALICALHRERRMHLPEDRIKLYEAALEMLLVRRDAIRGIQGVGELGLAEREQEALLQRFAYWMIRNGYSEVSFDQACERIGVYLAHTSVRDIDPADVLRHLLTRSGVLREPGPGLVDFVHRTFQEFLAARQALEEADIAVLLKNAAADGQWREVVVMAVGLAREGERNRLVQGLLKRSRVLRRKRPSLLMLAADAIGNAPTLDPSLRDEVAVQAAQLLPPSSSSRADSLAKIGESVLDVMPDLGSVPPARMPWTVSMLTQIGGDAAMELLARYAAGQDWSRLRPDDEDPDLREVAVRLYDGASAFEPAAYAEAVLRHVPCPDRALVNITSAEQAGALAVCRGVRWVFLTELTPETARGLAKLPELNSIVMSMDRDAVSSLDMELLYTIPGLRKFVVLTMDFSISIAGRITSEEPIDFTLSSGGQLLAAEFPEPRDVPAPTVPPPPGYPR